MTVESLKKEARRHEQREEWAKALDLYLQAIERQGEEGEPDIALNNRVGDLQIRLGDLEGAIESYDQAIRLYAEAELPNNAIAICRKIVRHDPERPEPFLRMGRIRAKQGFAVDARENFVTYAEMMQARGETEEALRALEEFVGLAPEDIETRLFLAEQLVTRDRASDASRYLSEAFGIAASSGETDRAETILSRIREIEPDFEPDDHIRAMESGTATAAETTEETWPIGYAPSEPESNLPPLEPIEFEETPLESGLGETRAQEEEEEAWGRGEAVGEEVVEEVSEEETLPPAAEGAMGEDEPLLAGEFSLDDLDAEGSEEPTISAGEIELEPSVSEVESSDIEIDVEDLDLEPAEVDLDIGDLELETSGVDLGDLDLEVSGADIELAEEGEEGGEAVEPAVDSPPFEPAEESDVSQPEEPADVVAALRARVEREPGDANAWEGLGEALLTRGWLSEGRDALDRAHRLYAERGEAAEAIRVVRGLLTYGPQSLELRQRMVEYAHETGDRELTVEAFLELAEGLDAEGEPLKAAAVFEQVLALDPENDRALEALRSREAAVSPAEDAAQPEREEPHGAPASSEGDYVDLGAMILESEAEGSTRFVVPTEEPSGDEEADFARMLSQFKEKVAQNISSDDARSHYDLGAAYKEMGLFREAIGEFQQALRAQPHNLATFEMLGQCFLEMGDPEIAIRTLERGLKLPTDVEDDLLGVYYGLAKAHEKVGDADAAREFYERIFSLDINFKDVVERLNALR